MKNNPMFWLVLALALTVVVTNSFFVVDQRERSVLFQLGEIVGTDNKPGLHFKMPFFQSVRRFNARILTLEKQTDEFLTVEKKNVEVDFYTQWRIADPATYYRATGGDEVVASDRLTSIVSRSLRDQFGARTIQQAVSDERDAIVAQVKKDASAKVQSLGIEIVDIRMKSINLPKDVSNSVYERMRAERTRVAADLRARGAEEGERIRAEADREAQITLANAYKDAETLKGEGDAKATDIYARAYGQDAEFFSFYRSLNVYRDSFSGGNNLMVLEPKGEFFRYFRGSGQ